MRHYVGQYKTKWAARDRVPETCYQLSRINVGLEELSFGKKELHDFVLELRNL